MTRALALGLILVVAGCGRTQAPGTAQVDSRLEQVSGCDALVAKLRARAAADMSRLLDANLASWGRGGGIATMAGAPLPAASDAARTHSTTNVQVAGVDEPDSVKTDGRYAYVAAAGRLQILAAWPAAETRRLSAIAIEGTPTKLLLAGDRALVFSSLDAPPPPAPPFDAPILLPFGGAGECTYGYECVPQGDGRPLKLTVVDVADRAAPRVLREVTFSGTLLAARRIADAAHVVVSSGEHPVPGLRFWPALPYDRAPSEDDVRAAFEKLRAENLALIAAADASAFVPTVKDVRHAAGGDVVEEGPLGACSGYWVSAEGKGNALLSVASLPASGEGPLRFETAVGRPGFVAASPTTLYVAAPVGAPWAWDARPGDETTAIHAFRLRGGAEPGAEYAGSGAVAGRPLGSFSLDEHAGALRVATTIGHLPAPTTRSAVTVLRAEGGRLVEAGKVDGLAPGEDLRAVRFDGDRAFLVTFEKTDPLFVVDLADPAAPRVAGEVVVPGFSTYLQLMDPAHLLTIGYDADDQGGFAWFQGIQLQVFDVADPARPALAWRELIGTRGSSSGAATDHLAFDYFAPKDLLAIPLTVCTGATGGWTTGDVLAFSGLGVYRVTAAEGFQWLGGVAHQPAEVPGSYRGACASWWTQPNTVVERSLFLEDWVYSFTRAELRVQDTRALGADVARVDLAAP